MKEAIIHLSSSIYSLAEKLAENILKKGDPFSAPMILVPNTNLRTWLWMYVARKNKIAFNLGFDFLENGIHSLLRNSKDDKSTDMLGLGSLQLLVMLLLLEDDFLLRKEMQPVHRYLYLDGEQRPGYAKRLWQLSSRLARYLRDYTYHREDMLGAWLSGELFPEIEEKGKAMETCQREIYNAIFAEGGLLENLNKQRETLSLNPMQLLSAQFIAASNNWNKNSFPEVHVFGFSHISPLHTRILLKLAQHTPVFFYQLGPFSQVQEKVDINTEDPLLNIWGKAGKSMLALLRQQSSSCTFILNPESEEDKTSHTMLERLKIRLISPAHPALCGVQDNSIQLCACPSVYREAEMVFNSIIYNLENDPDLRLNDIAVLTTDIRSYRGVLDSVFSRGRVAGGDRHGTYLLPYNISDSSAAEESVFGQAIIKLLELADGDFTRREVFDLLRNPCFMEAAGLSRGDIVTWLNWADRLNIFHHFEKKDSHKSQHSIYSWKHGLQRLRLGRIMLLNEDDYGNEENSVFFDIPPYADMESSDSIQVGLFSTIIERLYKELSAISREEQTAFQWKERIINLMDCFLAVPSDRPEEGGVRKRILASLDELAVFDQLSSVSTDCCLSLAFIREYISEQLESLPGSKGRYLTDGISISSLMPMRPVPFRLVYIMGLGENNFPGSLDSTTLELRNQGKIRTGDVSFPDSNRYLFLETLLCTSDKLCLSYVSRDLEKDSIYYPCSVVNQLLRSLEENIIEESFEPFYLPLKGYDNVEQQNEKVNSCYRDLLVNYSREDVLLNLCSHELKGRLQLTDHQQKIRERALNRYLLSSLMDSPLEKTVKTDERINLRELARFLENPIEASIRRFLHLYAEDEEDKSLYEDEPFVSGFPVSWSFPVQVVKHFIEESFMQQKVVPMEDTVDYATYVYNKKFIPRGQTPAGAFAEVDLDNFITKISKRFDGKSSLADFLSQHLDKMISYYPWVCAGFKTTGNIWQSEGLHLSSIKMERKKSVYEISGELPFFWIEENGWHCLEVVQNNKDKYRLQPLLFYLAVQAFGLEGLPPFKEDDIFHIHISAAEKVHSYQYYGSPDDARGYLELLLEDFLDPACFELIPLELLQRNLHPEKLTQDEKMMPELFRELLLEKIDEETFRHSEAVDLTDVQPPQDVMAIVLKRLSPLFTTFLHKEKGGE